ncbi:MAG TPA: hypothetical protein VFQ85_02725 [Mycobacteriales bacterium]|nr:hypothetical protein [Mycobacteriales bacterium]
MRWPEGVPPKPELRAALRREHPWLDDAEFGPRNVTAGACDRCGAEARLVTTCGPQGGEYGRRCATPDDWCEGHAEEAARARAYLDALPPDADDVAWLWWLATGEVRPSPTSTTKPPIT